MIWDTDGREQARLPLPRPGSTLAVSADGLVAVITIEGAVLLADPSASGEKLRRLAGHAGAGFDVAFSPDGERLASSAADGKVLLHETSSGTTSQIRDRPGQAVERLHFTGDGRRLAMWSRGGAGGEPQVSTVALDLDSPRRDFAGVIGSMLASSAARLFSADVRGLLVLQPERGGRLLVAPTAVGQITDLVLLLPGDRLATALQRGDTRLWDLREGAATGLLLGHTEEIVAIEVSGDRALSASLDGSARVWELASGRELAAVELETEILAAAWAPGGERFALAATDGIARVYAASGAAVASFGEPGAAPAIDVRFAPDGASLLALRADGTATRYALAGPTTPPERLAGGAPEVTAIAWSPGGARIATGHLDGSTRLWDATTASASAAPLASWPGDDREGVAALRFLGDERLLVAFPSGRSLLASAQAPSAAPVELTGRPGEGGASPLSAGSLLLIGPDQSARLHTLTGGPARELTGHTGSLTDAAFSADGRLVATASADGIVRVVDASDGQLLFMLSSRPVVVRTRVAWSGDGRWLLAGDDRGGLRLHPATPEGALARACDLLDAFGRAADAGGHCDGAARERTEKSRNNSRER